MTTLMSAAWLAIGMTIPLSGTVVDADGRPAAGAMVWLADTHADHKGAEVMAAVEADERGGFRLERDAGLEGRGSFWSPTLWAYRPGARIAHLEFKGALPAADQPVRLALGPPASLACQVFRPDGKPAQGAVVRLVNLNDRSPRPPDELRDRLAATADAEGRATLDGLAPEDVVALDVTYDGQLVQYLPIDPDDGSLALRPLGGLKVRIVADDPKQTPGWRITATSRPEGAGQPSTHWRRETTGADGRIAFGPMAEGVVSFQLQPPEGSMYCVAKLPSARIQAGETQDVEIAVERGGRVEGFVKDAADGAPIPGVRVDVVTIGRPGSSSSAGLVSDDRGRVSAVVPPGKVRFHLSTYQMPREWFLPPGVQGWIDVDVKAGDRPVDVALPSLRKAVLVRGRVLDENGATAVGASVLGGWTSAEFGDGSHPVNASTDARGDFVLGNIPPNARVTVGASSGWVKGADSVVVPRAGEGEPITLNLRKKPTLALSGRVLGPDGRPRAGATIRAVIRPPNQPYFQGNPINLGEEPVLTDAEGRYQTPSALPLNYEYRVSADAPGCEPAFSRWIVDPKVSVPDLTLGKAVPMRAVSGRVVDSFGRPVVGAEVFLRGGGSMEARKVANADGRFRFMKLPDAPTLLFVARKGHRFDGRRIETGDQTVLFVLRRLDEPSSARLAAAASPVSRDEERAVVRALTVRLRADAIAGNAALTASGRLSEVEALVDPDRMIEKMENQVVPIDPNLLAAAAIGRSEGDPRKVLEVFGAIDASATAATTALSVFDRLGPSARPAFRRELLERAEREARRSAASDQAASDQAAAGRTAAFLARVADRRLDLGDVDRGAALAREALAIVEKPIEPPAAGPRAGAAVVVGGPYDPFHLARNDVALALARVDARAALKLIDVQERQPHQSDHLRVEVARRIAGADPAATGRLIGRLQEFAQQGARMRASIRMAERDLPAAQALAAEVNVPWLRAVLPAFAAKARAESDPQQARELLREAVERTARLGDRLGEYPSPAVILARLLPLVVRIDPERASSCLWLALSRRPSLPPRTPQSPWITSMSDRLQELAELAALTARYDRAAAGVVFAPVADRLPELDAEAFGMGGRISAIFWAAGAYDARAAAALLDVLPDDPPPTAERRDRLRAGAPALHNKTDARMALAEALATPPRLRLRGLFRPRLGGVDWLEGFDDRGAATVEGP